jgi:hypothetical protein
MWLYFHRHQTTSPFFFINKFAKPFSSSSERFFSNSFASAVSAAPAKALLQHHAVGIGNVPGFKYCPEVEVQHSG